MALPAAITQSNKGLCGCWFVVMGVEPGRLRLVGQVVALLANYCWVELDQLGPTGLSRLLCTGAPALVRAAKQLRWGIVSG